MSDAAQLLLSGIALGFSIAAPPGPVNVAAARHVATQSWTAGWSLLLGAMTADALFFAATYYGIVAFVPDSLRIVLLVVGGAFLLYLASSGLRTNPTPPSPPSTSQLPPKTNDVETSVRPVGTAPYLTGLTLGLSNPYQLAWWLTVGIGMVSAFGPGIVAGFFTGIAMWTILFVVLVHSSLKRFDRAYPLIVYSSRLLLAAFGIWFLVEGVTGLLPGLR